MSIFIYFYQQLHFGNGKEFWKIVQFVKKEFKNFVLIVKEIILEILQKNVQLLLEHAIIRKLF